MSRVQVARAVIPRICKDTNELEFWTTCGPDDQFSSPKQIRWSAALGKLHVSNNGATVPVHIRNADLSFFSKWFNSTAGTACDSDSSNFYFTSLNNIRKWDLGRSSYTNLVISSIRMIDASGDPDYVYVTSNNAADHHGFRQVKKSTMAVTATALADGSGDGQFDDPLGIFYYNSEIFVADYDNSRVSVWIKSGETLTYSRKYDLGFKPMDLCFDGTNWFVQSATTLYKYDDIFTDATKTSVANVGYSITLIPDQGDGNGATIGFTDNTNSHIGRRKCSDLSLINEVGSSGDGSASLFDPVITGPAGTWYMDDGSTFAVASAANISWNGFSGYTFKTAGPHRAIFKPAAGGLAAVTAIDCSVDLVTSIKTMKKLAKCTSFIAHTNAGLRASLLDLPSGLTIAYFSSDPLLTGGSIASLVDIQDLSIYDMGWLSADVDTVLLSVSDAIHANVNHFTYATPSLQIGGTNKAPGGTAAAATTSPSVAPGDGNSDSDWLWDAGAGKHKALTGMAAIYVMRNNTGHVWTVTATGVA